MLETDTRTPLFELLSKPLVSRRRADHHYSLPQTIITSKKGITASMRLFKGGGGSTCTCLFGMNRPLVIHRVMRLKIQSLPCTKNTVVVDLRAQGCLNTTFKFEYQKLSIKTLYSECETWCICFAFQGWIPVWPS